ncbi:hypothetical protein AO390_03340 [Pseudomonas marginalis ICMP 11289]|nr:hypothetical protein AO390_03340 [Pseudomonas marginalis ICMP 11289]
MMKSIEPVCALKLLQKAFFAAIWGVFSGLRLSWNMRQSGLSSIFNGLLYKKMNKAKLDRNP